MKKIFSIIAASLSGLVLVFITTLGFIKTNVPISYKDPVYIYVFNQSSTATATNGYSTSNSEFSEIMKNLKKSSSVSAFTRLVNGTDIKPKIEQDVDGTFTTYSTDIKQDNIVVELVYDKQQDMVVYVGEDTKVISYYCLTFVIPLTYDFADIVVYYATTNSDDSKTESYQKCEPLVIKGKAKKLIKYVETL